MITAHKNIYQRKDGRYEGRLPNGRSRGRTRYLYVYAGTYEEVEEKLRLLKDRADAVEAEGAQAGDFAAAAEEWLAARSRKVKPSTAAKYRQVLDTHLLPAFGGRKFTEITREDVAGFSEQLLEEGLSVGTAATVLSIAKNLFSWVSREKGLALTDIRGISVRQEYREMRVLTPEEQEALTRYLAADASPRALGILLCLYTGLRIGELCAVKWEDISRTEKTLYVHRTVQRIRRLGENRTEVIVSAPKSGCSVRRIPIPEELCRLLDCHRQAENVWLLNGRADRCPEPRAVQYGFKKLLADCGVADTNFHTLRHTFATRCVELGFDIKTLSVLLGHSNVGITMDRYVHPTMEMKKRDMGRLSSLFGPADAPSNAPS